MSLLRPSCAAIARRFCSQSHFDPSKRPSLLSILQSRSTFISTPQSRSFSSSSRYFAKVKDLPETPQLPSQKARTVRIGPLPDGKVGNDVIKRIFGQKVTPVDGNNVLRIIHHRRTSGSLADYGVDNLGKQYTHVNRTVAIRALEWLRNKYPVDEARAAQEWAEKEANRIAYELWLADPENDSKYKDPARAFREQQQKEKDQMAVYEQEDEKMGLLHVGRSQLERNAEEKRRKRLEEVTRKAEEKERKQREDEEKLATGEYVRTPSGTQLMKPGQETYVDVFGREQVSRRKEEREKYQKASQSHYKTEQQMLAETTVTQRVVPMTVFVAGVVFLSVGFAYLWEPPAPEYRLFPSFSESTCTTAGIIAINVLICASWRSYPLWPFLTRFFMHVPGRPRAVQAILNVFSHVQYEHLLSNMFMLAVFGPLCHDLVDRGVFMGTYMSAGAVGTLASLYWANFGRGPIASHSVGASAAIWGISTLYLLLTDHTSVKVPFLKDTEFSFWPKALLGALFAMEVFMARRASVIHMDHASHFGGMFVGAVVAWYLGVTGKYNKSEGAVGAETSKKVDETKAEVEKKRKMDEMIADVERRVKEEVERGEGRK